MPRGPLVPGLVRMATHREVLILIVTNIVSVFTQLIRDVTKLGIIGRVTVFSDPQGFFDLDASLAVLGICNSTMHIFSELTRGCAPFFFSRDQTCIDVLIAVHLEH